MRIRAVEVHALALDAERPYLGADASGRTLDAGDGYAVRAPWRSLYSARYETMLVRLVAEDGTDGWGEALAPVGPTVVAEAARSLLAPQVVGRDATAPRALFSRLRQLMRERGHLGGHQADALAAVDIAAWDLAGRLLGCSVATLLGGAVREHVPVYVSGLPRPEDAGRAELAREWAARGATAVKLHLGHGVTADLATVDAVRAAAPQLDVAIDAHWAYSPAGAARLARGLTVRDAMFLEAPLAPEDVAGHARLAAAEPGLTVAVGEAMRHRYEVLPWLSAGAVGLLQPDVGRTGISEAWSIAEVASAHHVPVAPHHSVGLGPSMAAGLAVAAAVEDCPFFEFQPTTLDVARAALGAASTPGLDAGGAVVGTAPGLGIALDPGRIAALAVRSSTTTGDNS